MKSCSIKADKLLLCLVLIMGLANTGQAQLSDLSPYSRFGIGTLQDQSLAPQLGMGGVSISLDQPNLINQLNPATYSFLTRPAFLFELKNQWVTLSSSSDSENLRLTTINNFSFGFPFQKGKMGMAFGVLPFSRTGYSIAAQDEVQDAGAVTYRYDGEGGVNKAFIGLSRQFRIKTTRVVRDSLGVAKDTLTAHNHRISIGANLNYYFGSLVKTRRLEFDDTDFLNTRFSTQTSVQDLGADIGVHYTTSLFEKRKSSELLSSVKLHAAATYSVESPLTAKQTELAESFLYFGGVLRVVDTTYYVPETIGTLTIPSALTGSLALEIQNGEDRKWFIGAEYRQQDWTNFGASFGDANAEESLLDNATRISFGVAYTPRSLPKPGLNLFQRMTYRVGARTNDTYLRLNGQELTEQAITAGFSIPLDISRSTSVLNFGMELGSRGSTDNGLIEERFINVQIGFTLTPYFANQWFVQRKYD